MAGHNSEDSLASKNRPEGYLSLSISLSHPHSLSLLDPKRTTQGLMDGREKAERAPGSPAPCQLPPHPHCLNDLGYKQPAPFPPTPNSERSFSDNCASWGHSCGKRLPGSLCPPQNFPHYRPDKRGPPISNRNPGANMYLSHKSHQLPRSPQSLPGTGTVPLYISKYLANVTGSDTTRPTVIPLMGPGAVCGLSSHRGSVNPTLMPSLTFAIFHSKKVLNLVIWLNLSGPLVTKGVDWRG